MRAKVASRVLASYRGKLLRSAWWSCLAALGVKVMWGVVGIPLVGSRLKAKRVSLVWFWKLKVLLTWLAEWLAMVEEPVT